METKRKLRIGVFGGARGTAMIEVLLHHPDAELVAVCDKYKPLLENAEKEAEKCGTTIALFENFDEFVQYDMDAVVLANYAHEHGIFAVKCLRAGKHVLSEVEPFATMGQAVDLVEAVEQTGLVYAYAENYCYRRDTFEMWQRYKSGEMGEAMYGEGEYIHDCSNIWPLITYGEKDHWRNYECASFYNTHSFGPLMMMTGLRPKSVVGFEIKPNDDCLKLGLYRGVGVEMVTMENGSLMKSIHGWLKREPGSVNYQLYCRKGSMETTRLEPVDDERIPNDDKSKLCPNLNVYKEKPGKRCSGGWERYNPETKIAEEAAKNFSGHGGSDFYPTHFFIEKILGRPDGQWSIDVYQACDMGACGVLAYKSVLAGNKPIDVPDFRDPAQREAWRNDNESTFPDISGDNRLPRSSFGNPDIPDEVFAKIRELWLGGHCANDTDD